MGKTIINVGIIDDDETKRSQIMSKLDDFVDGASSEIKERYEDFAINPIELELKTNISDLLEEIFEKNIHALVIDYMLSSYEVAVDYTGVKFAEETDKKYLGFPVFILTSYEEELYQKGILISMGRVVSGRQASMVSVIMDCRRGKMHPSFCARS